MILLATVVFPEALPPHRPAGHTRRPSLFKCTKSKYLMETFDHDHGTTMKVALVIKVTSEFKKGC